MTITISLRQEETRTCTGHIWVALIQGCIEKKSRFVTKTVRCEASKKISNRFKLKTPCNYFTIYKNKIGKEIQRILCLIDSQFRFCLYVFVFVFCFEVIMWKPFRSMRETTGWRCPI